MTGDRQAVQDEDTLTPDGYMPRVIDSEMRRGLNAAGWVVVEGPRACGKTWTALRFARSAIRLDTDVNAREIGQIEPAALLKGRSPRLLDEWQAVPSLWNHVRHACDETPRQGCSPPRAPPSPPTTRLATPERAESAASR